MNRGVELGHCIDMASWLSRTAEFWNEWGLRIAVLSSLASHLALVLLAGTRRRNLSRWGWLLLWPAYQIADISATYALGNLSLGTGSGSGASSSSAGSSSSSCEQQLVAFWAPFLLLHLGRPDNISAYALEDNTLSLRQAVQVALQVAGASYVLYNYIYLGGQLHGGALLPASAIMFVVGVAKYVEGALALWRGNLEHIRSSTNNKKKKIKMRQQQSTKHEVLRISSDAMGRRWRELDHEQALRFAHDMFPFCQRAMVDSSVEVTADHTSSSSSPTRIFSLGWRSMCKVVEMELSLMYDVLYTKATVVHTWGGYLIRILSPFAVATAATFFWLLPKDKCLREADVIVTYMLLGSAFLLDVVWLVRALGSTWAFAFLDARPGAWLYHALLCSGRWHRLRRIFASLDPSSWLLGQDPRSYRMWSGCIGRYNLLEECTRPHGGAMSGRLGRWLATKAGLEEYYYSRRLSHQLGQDVKQLLFQRIQTRLLSSYRASSLDGPRNGNAAYSMKDITTAWGQEAVKRGGRQIFEADQLPSFGREFQEDILVWHIGTCILLVCADQQHVQGGAYGKAIEVLSEYLMFLVAVRSHMLPGLVLRSLFEVTRQAMADVWAEEVAHGNKNNRSSSRPRSRKEMLAKTLHELKFNNEDWGINNANTRLISDGIDLATVLLQVEETNMPQLMELVFNVWIDKLLYAGTRCSRESHARQLSHGAELTSIVWIITEHAGPFRIGETIEGTELVPFPMIEDHPPPKPKEEPPKKEEPAPPPPPPPPPPKEMPAPPPKPEEPKIVEVPYPWPYPAPAPPPEKKEEPGPPPPAKVEPPRTPPPMEPIESTKRKRRVKYATLYPPY